MDGQKLSSLLVWLTDEERAKFNQKRRAEGLTMQGIIRRLILSYIGKEEN